MLFKYSTAVKCESTLRVRAPIRSLERLSKSRVVVADLAGVSVVEINRSGKQVKIQTISTSQIAGVLFAGYIEKDLFYCLDYEGVLRLLTQDQVTKDKLEVKKLNQLWSEKLSGISRKGIWPYFMTITG